MSVIHPSPLRKQCACWESCPADAEDGDDLCWECRLDGCPGGRTGDDE